MEELNEYEMSRVTGGGEWAGLGMWWTGGGTAFGFVAGIAAAGVVVAGGIAAAPVLAAAAGVAGVAALAFTAAGQMVGYLDGLSAQA